MILLTRHALRPQHGARFAIQRTPSVPSSRTAHEHVRIAIGHAFDQPTMGLYVSKRLVRSHGGRVGIEGNALWFSLPDDRVS